MRGLMESVGIHWLLLLHTSHRQPSFSVGEREAKNAILRSQRRFFFRLVFSFREVRDGRAVQDFAIRIEAGTMAGTIPGFFHRIPAHNAAQVLTDGGARVVMA